MIGLLRATSAEMSTTAAWLEVLSFGLIALLGAWMLIARLRHYLFPARPAHPVGAAVARSRIAMRTITPMITTMGIDMITIMRMTPVAASAAMRICRVPPTWPSR